MIAVLHTPEADRVWKRNHTWAKCLGCKRKCPLWAIYSIYSTCSRGHGLLNLFNPTQLTRLLKAFCSGAWGEWGSRAKVNHGLSLYSMWNSRRWNSSLNLAALQYMRACNFTTYARAWLLGLSYSFWIGFQPPCLLQKYSLQFLFYIILYPEYLSF